MQSQEMLLILIVGFLSLKCHSQKIFDKHLGTDSLRFIVLGDYGGNPVRPYYTSMQRKLAETIGPFGDEHDIHFTVGLGDNFYIRGPLTVDSHRFRDTFENVYTHGITMYRPWYIIAGNHDHYGNVSAQIEYTEKSHRWVFPSLYYKVTYNIPGGSSITDQSIKIDLIFIDTVVLCGNNKKLKFNGKIWDMIFTKTIDPDGYEDKNASEAHWQWLETQLRESRAHYKLVFGHFPIWSVAGAGPTTCLVRRLRPLLHRYNVHAYFAGHDHNIQHLTDQYPPNNNSTMHYVISGAASRRSVSQKHADKVPYGALKFRYPTSWIPMANVGLFGTGGFVFVDVSHQNMTVSMRDGDANDLYNFRLAPRFG